MRWILISALAVGVLLLLFWRGDGMRLDDPQQAGAARAAEAGYPRHVRLADGTEVEIARRPQRILPGNAAAVDLLVDLVPPERVVALPAEALLYSSLADDPLGWTDLPSIHEFAGEEILALGPDLVIAHSWQAGQTLEVLRGSGLPVVQLAPFTDWDSIRAPIELLGRALGVEERASTLLAELETRRAALRATDRSHLSGLSYGNYGAGGSTSGTGTTWDLMLQLAGLKNAATDAGLTGHAPIDFEQLLALKPDFFVVASDPESGLSPSAESLRSAAALEELTALREERVIIMPSSLYSTASHRLLDAAEWLAERVDAWER